MKPLPGSNLISGTTSKILWLFGHCGDFSCGWWPDSLVSRRIPGWVPSWSVQGDHCLHKVFRTVIGPSSLSPILSFRFLRLLSPDVHFLSHHPHHLWLFSFCAHLYKNPPNLKSFAWFSCPSNCIPVLLFSLFVRVSLRLLASFSSLGFQSFTFLSI